MGLGWYAVILAVIAAVAVPVTLAVDGHRERSRFDAEIAAAEGRIEANRAGRHRMSQPREVPSSPPAAGRDPHPKVSAPPRPVGRYQPSMSGRYVPNRSHVSAADIGPVWWTEPGRPQAAPSKHGAPETTCLPRIRLVDDSTGGIRAIGDRIVAAIEAGELLCRSVSAAPARSPTPHRARPAGSITPGTVRWTSVACAARA